MKLFIDCEWNDYKGDLISMALVPESGNIPPFYQALSCENPTEWVAKNVLPVLQAQPTTEKEFTNLLHYYLDNFDDIEIVADWPEDIAHFCNALIGGPGQRIGPNRMTFTFDRSCGNSGSKVIHNALEDAIAIRNSYRSTPGD